MLLLWSMTDHCFLPEEPFPFRSFPPSWAEWVFIRVLLGCRSSRHRPHLKGFSLCAVLLGLQPGSATQGEQVLAERHKQQ